MTGLRPASPAATRLWPGRALVGTQLLLSAGMLVSVTNGRLWFPAYRVDLSVYRLGSAVLLHGGALYGPLPPLVTGERLACCAGTTGPP